MKINTLNTLSQNNPAFGVRIPINEVNISGLKQRQRLIANPQLDKPAGEKVLDIICDKIMNTKQKKSCLISFFQDIARRSSEFIGLLEKSGKTLERAFWETCDKFFDVQLVANDKDIDNISDDKIKEDRYLIRIFHPLENNIEINIENKKPTIEYCIKNYSEAKDDRKKFCEKIKDELNPDMEVSSIRENILGPILRLPKKYNDFKGAIQKEKPTFTEFKEYLKNKAPSDNNRLYNSGNGELLAYTIETFKKYVPEFKEEFVFAEDTIADANTIGKEMKKNPSTEQSYKDALCFIDYYIDNNIINSKQTTKEIYSALFEANRESNPNENHITIGTLYRYRLTLNKIKETLEIYPNKTDEEIKNDIKNEYHSMMNCILGKKEIFSRAINKLRALNKTTNDNIIEESDSDNYYIDNDTFQANIASIKRMHVTMPLDIDKTCFKDEILEENECEVFNTENTLDEINMFETKRQHVILNQGAPILPNLNNKTVIPMPQAMDNFENEKRPHLSEQSPSGDDNNIGNIFTPISFIENNVTSVTNYGPRTMDNDNKSIKEKDDSQRNYDETTPLIGHDDGMLYGTSFFNDNIPQFNNNNTDFFYRS